ncbi:MAG: methyltransferase domain-containing protein [Candidatus Schekmanbacteria bacterium]|nr:methyltransferase domain-containing protein [Candidatus Schekmanbacteria bacterium]
MKTLIVLLKGMATYIPGLYNLVSRNRERESSARYCYSVWLRHLKMACQNGLTSYPEVVAELGPGNSLGTGLAALIAGANAYYALDVVEYAGNKQRNIEIFEELVELFKKRTEIPDETAFPRLRPYLDSYEFPGQILSEEHLAWALHPDRIGSIKNALLNLNNISGHGIKISFYAPWYDTKVIKNESVNLIFSQAVLEHVDDLTSTYEALYRWLKPGGFMSHEIDFKSHGTAKEWNGHWKYSDIAWKLIRGKRPYLINRQPYLTHLNLLQKSNFNILCNLKIKDHSGIRRNRLALRFKNMSEDDLTTRGVFIQATKAK